MTIVLSFPCTSSQRTVCCCCSRNQFSIHLSSLHIPQRSSCPKSNQASMLEAMRVIGCSSDCWFVVGDCRYVPAVRFQRNRCRLPIFLSNDCDSNFDKKRH